MLSKIISRWNSMMLSQKIVGFILLLLFVGSLSVPIYNQVTAKAKTKQVFIEICDSTTEATDNENTCDCAWNKALEEYGYDKIEKQIKYNGSVDPVDLFTWILDCKA